MAAKGSSGIRGWCDENALKYKNTTSAALDCVDAVGGKFTTAQRYIQILFKTKGKKSTIPADYSKMNKLKKEAGVKTVKQLGVSAVPKHASLSEQDLKSLHDPYYKLDQAIKSLSDGQFILEADFREHVVKISTVVFRKIADAPSYDKYCGKASGKIYWGSANSIRKMKDEGVLA